MIWDLIRGHQRQVEWFRRAICGGRLSHAYVLAGPSGIGKRLFARTLAQCLFCQKHSNDELLACGECPACKQVLAGSHPDLHQVAKLPDKSEFTLGLLIGDDEKRGREGLCHDLSLLPIAADRKIAIIDDAAMMNEEAANAFLKTLEEPQSKSLLLLLADNLNALLPTIRSRCQLVRFDPLPSHDVRDLLRQLGWVKDPAEAAALAELSSGSLDVAEQLLSPALRTLRDGMYQELAKSEFNWLALSERLTSGLEEIGGDSAAVRRNAQWLVRFGLEFFRSALLYLTDQPEGQVIPAAVSFARRFDARTPEDLEVVISLFDRVAETEPQIDTNASVPRCLDAMCEELGQKLRPAVRR